MWEFVQKHASTLDSAIRHDRDFEYDYFAYKTLERSYLLRINGRVVEEYAFAVNTRCRAAPV